MSDITQRHTMHRYVFGDFLAEFFAALYPARTVAFAVNNAVAIIVGGSAAQARAARRPPPPPPFFVTPSASWVVVRCRGCCGGRPAATPARCACL